MTNACPNGTSKSSSGRSSKRRTLPSFKPSSTCSTATKAGWDIDFREFVLAIGFLNNTQLEDAVDLSFRCLDLNRDGTISKQEMRECIRLQWQIRKHLNLLSSSSQPVALGQVSLVWSDTPRINAEADELFAKLDADGDGSITKEEFMAAVQRDPQLKAKIESLLLKSQTEKIFQL
ncbi:EF hand domain containing protein, variant 2 [Balamuthia mandrillaris]